MHSGTTVPSGLAVVTITAIGNLTRLGQIGKSLESIPTEKTPLEGQINSFVKKMVLLGVVVFIIVWAINFFRSHQALDSLLKALTLAMSILPEEIPVAFTTFMALGAWRLMKMGIVVRQMKTVETLGNATALFESIGNHCNRSFGKKLVGYKTLSPSQRSNSPGYNFLKTAERSAIITRTITINLFYCVWNFETLK